jgi:hypothetical protein
VNTITASTASQVRIWTRWVDEATCMIADVAATTTWKQWYTTGTATTTNLYVDYTQATATAEHAWLVWTDDIAVPVRRPIEAPAIIRAREDDVDRRLREYAEANARAAVSRDEAIARAEKLLLENLSLRQRLEYRRDSSFVVHGRRNRYRIRKGYAGNVDVIDKDGCVEEVICLHPREGIPSQDVMLIQRFMLEFNEEEARRTALSHGRPMRRERVMEPLH